MTQPPEKPDPAEYVLGLDADVEGAAAEQAQATEPAFEAEVVAWADRLSPLDGDAEATVPPAVWSGIAARIEEAMEMPGIRTVQPDTGVWEAIAPGVARRVVYHDRRRQSLYYFLRLRAGAVLPAHEHPGDEHCVVLEGVLRMGSTVFGVGSYQFAEEGKPHPPVTAESPALLFIQGMY